MAWSVWFFAVFPDAEAAARIEALARRLRREHGLHGQPLRRDRFHVSLCALPEPRDDGAVLFGAAAATVQVAVAPFEVTFDRVGSFRRARGGRPLVLRPAGPSELAALQARITAALALRRACYTPHLTLLYDAREVADGPVEPIRWTVKEVVLVQSLVGSTRYVRHARWPLRASDGVSWPAGDGLPA